MAAVNVRRGGTLRFTVRVNYTGQAQNLKVMVVVGNEGYVKGDAVFGADPNVKSHTVAVSDAFDLQAVDVTVDWAAPADAGAGLRWVGVRASLETAGLYNKAYFADLVNIQVPTASVAVDSISA